jgi:hypothetical protein
MNRWKVIIPVALVVAGIAIATANGANPMMLVVALAIASVAICWIVFPLIVVSKFNELLKVDREILNAQSEIAKALQWMVDNWKDEGSKPPPV